MGNKMVKHCPICNASSADVIFAGELCSKCAGKKLEEKLPPLVKVERCRICGRIQTKEGVMDIDQKSLQLIIQQRLNKFKINLISHEDNKAVIDVVEEGWSHPVVTEKEIEIKYSKMTCESCYKKQGGYFEATMQLRGDEERAQRFAERFKRYIEERGGFIAEVKKVEGGYDIYTSSKAIAAAYLKEKEIKAKASYTLSGLNKSGKKVYKNTYAIRL